MRTLIAAALCLCCLTSARPVYAERALPPGCSGAEAERGVLNLEIECADALADKGLPRELRVNALLYRGLWHHRASRYELAVHDYDAGLDIDPNHPKLLQLRAIAHFRHWEITQAKELLEKSASVDPTRSTTMEYLGRIADIEDDTKKALGYFNLALELRPANHVARYMRAAALFNAGRGLDALADTEALLKVDDKTLDASGWVTVEAGVARLGLAAPVLHGKVLGLLDRHAEGEAHFTALVERHPSALAFSERAVFLLTRPIGLGKESRARDALVNAERAVLADPEDGYAQAILATCFETIKDYGKALSANEQALEFEKRPTRLIRLGWQHARILRMLGRSEEATPIAQMVLFQAYENDRHFFSWLLKDLDKRGYWRDPDRPDQALQIIQDAAAACMLDNNCGWH